MTLSEWVTLKDFTNYEITRTGEIRRKIGDRCRTHRYPSQHYDKDGYKTVALFNNSKRKTCKVHRLVADTFIPNPLDKPHVNHKNGKKDDNYVNNLEWATESENTIHAHETGLVKKRLGSNVGTSKLNEDSVAEIKKLLMQGNKQYKIAEQFGVSKQLISCIKKGEIWSHVKV